MPTDTEQYCACMESIKRRLALVLSVTEGRFSAGNEEFDAELVCVQLRKTLELIAFASLSANKEKYSRTHQDFAKDWNAKRLLKRLEQLHPDFYPKPGELVILPDGGKHVSLIEDGFLTRDEFVTLYEKCSGVIHARNPFHPDPPVINFGYSIQDWAKRIQRLLAFHFIRFVDRKEIWVVQMSHPDDGKVHVFNAAPNT